MKSKINNLKKGNDFGKFYKLDLNFDDLSLNTIEDIIFKIILSGCKIINTDYDKKKISIIKKYLRKANEKLKEFEDEITIPLISINFELKNENIEQLISKIKKYYSSELSFDILNIKFRDQNDYFIDQFLNELCKIENPLIYIINLNRKKLSNSSILKIATKFYQNISRDLILEIDYVSLNSNEEDLNTDLQIVSTADIIFKDLIRENKSYKKISIILPIKNQSNLINLASQCSIKYDGINLKDINFTNSINYTLDYKSLSNDLIKKIKYELKNYLKISLNSNLFYQEVTDK